MDHRESLRQRTVLPFEGMACTVEQEIGRGSNAIVYKGTYPDRLNPEQVHHVLIKELFPYDPRGRICRGESGQILVEQSAREHYELHRQSFVAGNEIHLRLLAEHPELPGANLNSFSLNGTLYSVLGYNGGRSLSGELEKGAGELKTVVKRMLGLLEALEAFHKSGWLHLDISPDNIMLTGTGESERVFLIDYNSARGADCDDPLVISFRAGYSPPEVENGSVSQVGYWSDLYSVAAVFYRCLMGRALTLEERLKPRAPDGSDSPLLSGAPQTVSAMVRTILRKGLNVLPGKRYPSIGQMRRAFDELADRIDCVGVTHWALWETGKKKLEERIRLNPSLRYLTDRRELYPIRLERSGKTIMLEEWVAELRSPEGRSGLVLASGGMGKTTLLLHTARMGLGRYTPGSPAVVYLSMNGWEPGDGYFIRDKLLGHLRFRRGHNSYDSARHELERLLSQPLNTKAGKVPAVLLLLDGLNELRGDPAPLIREINALAALPGVRVVAASRSPVPELALDTAKIVPLTDGDIAHALGQRGLLMPGESQTRELLRTPLILSLCIRSGLAGKPMGTTRRELMEGYLAALLEKEQEPLSGDSPERWQLDAAIRYVLPRIAREQEKRGRGLTDGELLQIVTRCRRSVGSGALRRVFPEWIGHKKEILGDTKDPEGWYGLMIHNLLWRRLGLLLRESGGVWSVYHQMVGEHLAEADKRRFAPVRRGRIAALILAACLTAAVGVGISGARYLDDEDARRAVEYAASGYCAFGGQYERLRELTDLALAGDQEGFAGLYDTVLARTEAEAALTRTEELYQTHIRQRIVPGQGKRVSWSGEGLEAELALELIGRATERSEYYAEALPLLKLWMESEGARTLCPEFAGLLSAVLEADADVTAELYHQVCAVHLQGGAEQWRQSVHALVAESALLDAHRELTELQDRDQYLENLFKTLQQAQAELERQRTVLELMAANS